MSLCALVGTSAAGVLFIGVGPASAHAPTPTGNVSGTITSQAGTSVEVTLRGTWTSPDPTCASRYGEGWAVDWWGIGPSATPAVGVAVTGATYVLATSGAPYSVVTTGTLSPSSSAVRQVANTGDYFHLSTVSGTPVLDGEALNSQGGCAATSTGSSGGWSASATYPRLTDVPSQLCVALFNLHSQGKSGEPTPGTLDPATNGDNTLDGGTNPLGNPADCWARPVLSTAALSSAASPSTGVAGTGSTFSDTLTVAGGGVTPTGSATFALYTAGCASVEVGAGTAVALKPGGGGSSTATYSLTWVPPAAGVYYWRVDYSGDTHYRPGTEDASCNVTAESIDVSAAPSPPSTPSTPPHHTPPKTPPPHKTPPPKPPPPHHTPPPKVTKPGTGAGPDFVLSKSDVPGNDKPVDAGATIAYTILVRNAGKAKGSVVVSDALPGELTLASPQPRCGSVAAGDSCRVSVAQNTVTIRATLSVGHAVPVVLTATVSRTARASVDNTATVVSGQCSACSASVVNPVIALSGLERSAPPDNSVVSPSTTITYDVVLSDGGTGKAGGVTVSQAVPAGTTYVPGSASCGRAAGCAVTQRSTTVTWSGVTVPGQSKATLRFAVTVNSGDTDGERISDGATFTYRGTPGCATPTCRTNVVSVVVGVGPALRLSRSILSPGQGTTASGVGCPAGSAVQLDVRGHLVGTGRANGDGSFSIPINPPDQLPGPETVVAVCGSVRMQTTLSIVDTAKASSPEGFAGVFGVFVLLGGLLVKGQYPGAAGTRRRRKKGADAKPGSVEK